MAEQPIFYDPSGRRRRRFALAVSAFLILLLLAVGVFVESIVTVEPMGQLPFEMERPALHGLPSPIITMARRAGKRLRHSLRQSGWLPSGGRAAAGDKPLAVGFYTPWDDASTASLARHVGALDWLVPGWISVTGPDHHLTLFPDRRGRAILDQASRRPLVLPMVQNAIEGVWDGRGAAALLADGAARRALLVRLEGLLAANHADGVVFDLEDLPPTALPHYLQFLREARARFGARHWLVTLAAPVDNPDWDLPAFARVADKLFLMAYDEHSPGSAPGPIASQGWFAETVSRALGRLPPGKAIVAIGSYAYDWRNQRDAEGVSVEQAWLTAHESSTVPQFDRASGNSAFAYDEGSETHNVWILDAASVFNQMAAVRAAGHNGFALWRMGSEDPSVWRIFGRHSGKSPNAALLEEIPAGTNVDIEGTGEILRVGAVPVPGRRTVQTGADGLVASESFRQLPLPYTIERAGYRSGLVALTFDDGPDPVWTPRILDVLKGRHVPATFFVIGENALTQRGLLERIMREGHEVGNHTYTHPNLGEATPRETELELNATQRLFQAFTGRSMRLFRAPYFGDAEPTTADEINPVATAQTLGYLSVGLHVDPADWKRPGARAIVDQTIAGVTASNPERSGQVVLLHDGGGDRAQTVAALPAIIDGLRQRGYRFVPVSQLIDLPPSAAMPVLGKSERAAAEADLALFSSLGMIIVALRWLFVIAITLGIARALLLSGLALREARRESWRVFPPIDPGRFVSVLIPAFNEAKVIERSVRGVLASRDVTIEVIVIDDGSSDGTGTIVAGAFADEPRVRLLSLENGGKARALNQGLALARGDVIVALDADTQFEATTIARLARWFVDPELGAVAGNAKVGNRVNLITRWQALEYVTAQNLERRALATLDAITVVPGAVGAWRAETLRALGGFPNDTLAEDQDLTIAVQRAGWTVSYDQYAVAWTEAPETLRALAKQRYRWAFGTLQCIWKHRAVLKSGQPRGLARIGLPQAILFQIGFAAVSPVIDLALLLSMLGTALSVEAHGWAQTQTDVQRMLVYWLIFALIDLMSGVIAFALERREKWRLLWLMIPQRFGYRQIMYYVVLKALAQAVRGPLVGWGKLERSGRVEAA